MECMESRLNGHGKGSKRLRAPFRWQRSRTGTKKKHDKRKYSVRASMISGEICQILLGNIVCVLKSSIQCCDAHVRA